MHRLIPLLLLAPLAAGAATPVTTAPLTELLLADERSAPATLVAANSPALAAEISARIDHIPVRVGDRVAAGATLVSLDCRRHRSQLDASRARLAQLTAQQRFAAEQLQRARDLERNKSISEELLGQRQSELDSLQAQVAAQRELIVQAGLDVEHCTVSAPFDGVVSERLASVGDLAGPGTPLIRLVQLDGLEISAQLRESEAAELGPGTRYWFAYQGSRHPLQLRRLLPVVDSRTRSRESRFTIQPGELPAGAAGRLLWLAGDAMISADYLVRRGERLGVFRLDDGKARFHPLPGALEGQPAVIDLPPDTAIIVEGRYGLTDGETVDLKPRD